MQFKNNPSPFRKYVIGTETKIPLAQGKLVNYINFDNAATTPPLVSVIKAICDFAPWYSSIHRGKGYKSRLSSNIYEESRAIIADFVKADLKDHCIIYVKNTSEAINKLSYRLCPNKEDVILSSVMEHHSNDLPWRNKYTVDYISLNNSGYLSLEDLESKLIKYQGRVKLLTVTAASNVTGCINPIYKMAGLAHKYGVKIMVDGAQYVAHQPFNMKGVDEQDHIDYLVFSAHKMYAPFGIGVLIGPKDTFNKGEPDYKGGGTVDIVTPDLVKWATPPQKDEAGTPNIMGVVALTEAIKTLQKLNLNKIAEYEHKLTTYALNKLKQLPNLILYCKQKEIKEKQVAIIPFNIKGLSHEIVATILAEKKGIAIRNGCFCAQPYIQKLLNISSHEIKRRMNNSKLEHPGLLRISFAMYNEYKEIDILIELLQDICENRKYYLKKYNQYNFN